MVGNQFAERRKYYVHISLGNVLFVNLKEKYQKGQVNAKFILCLFIIENLLEL